jgi:hypothetical protein
MHLRVIAFTSYCIYELLHLRVIAFYHAIINASNININTKGNNTKNHAISGAPAPQIKFKIHVQNNIYINLTINTKIMLDTVQE